MKNIFFTFLAICFHSLSFGQISENQKMIELAKDYKNFMFRNEPTKEILEEIKSNVPENLKTTSDFIAEAITSKNKLLSQSFLSRPENDILKQLYIIRAINFNIRKENQIDNNKLIDSLLNKDLSVYELIDNYYDMLFTSVGNKNQPFDLSKTNFKMNDYNFKDETEKGIMYLICMDFCSKTIWGYMNIVKPANTSKAYDYIKKFPKFNDQKYYQYTDFYFTDFEMEIVEGKGIQSYKSYYLDKYYETLLSHLLCLNKENKSEKEKNDLLLGSILKESNLYKYTKYQKTLESIFEVHKIE